MLKRLSSGYGVGRSRGDWWKWKVDPLTRGCGAHLRPARQRQARRTLHRLHLRHLGGRSPGAVRQGVSGLTDEEIRKVDAFVRRNTLEKFGPVRTVKPELVFELAFEGIQRSSRHKSGIAVRFPADGAVADRQEGGGGGYHRNGERAIEKRERLGDSLPSHFLPLTSYFLTCQNSSAPPVAFSTPTPLLHPSIAPSARTSGSTSGGRDSGGPR